MASLPESLLVEPTTAPATTVCLENGHALPHATLQWLLDLHIVLPEEWEELPEEERKRVEQCNSLDELLDRLHYMHLLTRFQLDAIKKGNGEELVLGSYRLLDVIGQGGMGTVYRGEHTRLRRQVAIKVMTRQADSNTRMVNRFYAEARAVARIQHPNIVACFDAGRCTRSGPIPIYRDYFVMELIPGQDLYALVRDKGPLSPYRACDLFRQVAEALAEAHRHGLIHRDIKPSNILVTPDWQAKLLDFGLARVPTRNVTEPGTLLGTIGYMAPEQARDPRNVDSRADLFSLGASMYWALTGHEPYPETGNPLQDLHRRLTSTPPTVQEVRPEIPTEISDLVCRLMQTDPDQRPPSARAVASTLAGFCLWLPNTARPVAATVEGQSGEKKRERVLIVDDEDTVRYLIVQLLKDHFDLCEVADAETALEEIKRHPPDLVIVDVNLPGITGSDLVSQIRNAGWDSDRIKVLLMSGVMPDEALGGLASIGADDFLTKPFKPRELVSRVRSLMARRTHAQNGESSQPTLRIATHALQRVSTPPSAGSVSMRRAAAAEALSLTISRLLVEMNHYADGQWRRLVRSVRALADAVPDQGEYARLKDEHYLDFLVAVTPLYDLGIMAMPRTLLIKPERLSHDEFEVIQTHTSVGGDIMLHVAGKLGAEFPALPIAAEIIRYHHERWDGSGYPDMLSGPEIPLAARVVGLLSVYEALRTRRSYRPAYSHARAVKLITQEMQTHFDPVLLSAFQHAASRIEQIYLER